MHVGTTRFSSTTGDLVKIDSRFPLPPFRISFLATFDLLPGSKAKVSRVDGAMNCKQWLINKCGIPVTKVGTIVAYLEKECWIDNAKELSIRFQNDPKLLDQLKVPDMVKSAIRAALVLERTSEPSTCVSPVTEGVEFISSKNEGKPGHSTRSRGPIIDLSVDEGSKSKKRKRTASPVATEVTAEDTVNSLHRTLKSGSHGPR
jgi:hypothetical protein